MCHDGFILWGRVKSADRGIPIIFSAVTPDVTGWDYRSQSKQNRLIFRTGCMESEIPVSGSDAKSEGGKPNGGTIGSEHL